MRGAPENPWLRFVTYAVVQAGVFLLPITLLPVLLSLVLLAGVRERLDWRAWAGHNGFLLLVACLPALVGLPYAELLDLLAGKIGASVPRPVRPFADWREFSAEWLPALHRSLRFLGVLLSAAWLAHRLNPQDLGILLAGLTRPLGRRASQQIGRAAGLALAFFPWTRDEIRLASEAARLRGPDPRRHAIRHVAALALPLTLRCLEKARHSAEALSLRDYGLRDNPETET